jgi:hypothetical protein
MPVTPAYYDNDHDGVIESVLVGSTLLGGEPFTGTGLLAIIELQITYAPTTGTITDTLNINNPDTILLNPQVQQIPTTKTDGNYQYVGPPPPPIPTAIMYLSPFRIADPSLTPCTYFYVNVSIVNATNVYSFEFKLHYDQLILSVEEAVLGDLFPSTITPQVVIDNDAGILTFSATLMPSMMPVSGDGTLAILTFHVEGFGATLLDVYDFNLYDQLGNTLPGIAEDGFFSNILLSKLFINPSEVESVKLKPGYIFSVDVVVDDVENLYGYEFKLSYNTKMLTLIGIFIHPILNESNFRTMFYLDDSAGLLNVRVEYYPPAMPITTYTPLAIVTLTFKVDNVGSSVLDLYDTKIFDQYQQLISHETTDGFVATLIRDVAIVNVMISHRSVFEGTLVNISVSVRNMGNLSETFDVKVYYDDNLIETRSVTDLNPGVERLLFFIWNTSGVKEGVYIIKGVATEVPDEFNTTNNVYVDGSIEIKKLIRDVTLTYASAYPQAVYVGRSVNITFSVRNEGNLTETFDVLILYGSEVVGTVCVENLSPETEITLSFIWNTSNRQPCTNYTIQVEIPPLPEETDVADNLISGGYVKIKIMGDINGDGKVDIIDVSVVAAAFGSYPGHERWNPEADLDLNGKVDIRDIALVSQNFGKVC